MQRKQSNDLELEVSDLKNLLQEKKTTEKKLKKELNRLEEANQRTLTHLQARDAHTSHIINKLQNLNVDQLPKVINNRFK